MSSSHLKESVNFSKQVDPLQIQDLIDEHVYTIVEPWVGSIPFQLYKWDKTMGSVSSIFNNDITVVDIATYLNGQDKSTERLYFCAATYPPPPSSKEKIPNNFNSWIRLKRDLEKSALASGSPVLSNGGKINSSGNHCKIFVCSYCYRNKRDSKAKQPTEKMPHRSTTLINDRRNSRGLEGKKGVKRVKMTHKNEICKFGFSIMWDEYGYFVTLIRKSGHQLHNGHPKHHDPSLIPIPSRLLDEEEEETVNYVVESACNKAAGRNYMFKRMGKFISSMKIAYLNEKNKESNTKEDDIESMLTDFEKSDEIRFTTLSDVPSDEFLHDPNFSDEDFNKSSITVSTTKDRHGDIVNSPVSKMASIKAIEPLAKVERAERNLSASDILFIAIAWTILPALRLFMLCPEVIWVDVTSHSNNKGFDLLTFSCRTSVGKQIVFLWIWIPNQKRFSFRWVFSHALALLIPLKIRRRVWFIMKDGDSQQRNEVLRALNGIFPNATEGGCGWHISKFDYVSFISIVY